MVRRQLSCWVNKLVEAGLISKHWPMHTFTHSVCFYLGYCAVCVLVSIGAIIAMYALRM